MQPKPLRLLGLAKRAGKLVCGSDAVKGAAERSCLIVLAGDAGQNVRREAERYGKQIIELPYTKEELGHAVGKAGCAIATVTDKEFGQGIVLSMEES